MGQRHSGKKIKCPSCRAVLQVPTFSPEPHTHPADSDATDSNEYDDLNSGWLDSESEDGSPQDDDWLSQDYDQQNQSSEFGKTTKRKKTSGDRKTSKTIHADSWTDLILGKTGFLIVILGLIVVAPFAWPESQNWIKDAEEAAKSSGQGETWRFRRARRTGLLFLTFGRYFITYILPLLLVVRLPVLLRLLFDGGAKDQKRWVRLQLVAWTCYLATIWMAFYYTATAYGRHASGSNYMLLVFHCFMSFPVWLGLQLIVFGLMPERHMRNSSIGRAVWSLTQVTEVKQAKTRCLVLAPVFIALSLLAWVPLTIAMMND